MQCATCSERPPIKQWCGCCIICERCIRNTVLETGTIKCVHCRKVKPPSSRMMYLFLKDVFTRKKDYSYARQVLVDLTFTRKLYDFMVHHNMDTRTLVELMPTSTPELALHIIEKDPKRFCLFRHDIRNTPDVALRAVTLYNQNIEYVDQPTPRPILDVLAKTSGLVHVPEDERHRLEHKFDEILERKGNVDIFRVSEPTCKQWCIAARATPILASRVPNGDLTTVDGILRMAQDTRSVGFYRYLDEKHRQDRFLAYDLLQKQLIDFKTDFNFLEFILFKPSQTFTEGCMRSCPHAIRTAASYDDDTALFCVRRDGLLLECCIRKTLRICRAAVTQNGLALQFCPPEIARRLQVLAVTTDKHAVRYAPDKHGYPLMEISMPVYLEIYGASKVPPLLLRDHVELDPSILKYVEYKYQTKELADLGDDRFVSPALLDPKDRYIGSKMDNFIKKHGIEILAFNPPFRALNTG